MINSENFNAYLYNLNLIVNYFIYGGENTETTALTTTQHTSRISNHFALECGIFATCDIRCQAYHLLMDV